MEESYINLKNPPKENLRNAKLSILPFKACPLITQWVKDAGSLEPLSVAMIGDIFLFSDIEKILFAGINEKQSYFEGIYDKTQFNLLINISRLDGKNVYDVLFFIHMLAHYSNLTLNVYNSETATGKMIYSFGDKYGGISIYNAIGQNLCLIETDDKETIVGLNSLIMAEIRPENCLFKDENMKHMLEEGIYIRMLLSNEQKWLLGCVTEHLLPPQVLKKCLPQCTELSENVSKNIEQTNLLINKLMNNKDVKIVIYDTAVEEFVTKGEVDFYNHKITLPLKERLETLLYIKNLLVRDSVQMRLVHEGFSYDFRYASNPCFFLTEGISCLKLGNKLFEHNLKRILLPSLNRIFHSFYDEIWSNRLDVVVESKDEILLEMEKWIKQLELLGEIPQDVE